MKRNLYYIIACLTSFMVTSGVFGQTNISGDWSGDSKTGSYKLIGNTTLTSTISVSSATLTIDLNGYTLDRKGGGFVATVGEGRTLVIKDSSNGKGIIKNGRGDRGGAIMVSGILNLQGGTIQDCQTKDGNYSDTNPDNMHYNTQGAGGAIYIQQGGTVNMSGGTIKNCKTEKIDGTFGRGGAVFIDAEIVAGEPVIGTFNMTGGSIENCEASLGGAVYVHESVNTTGDKCTGVFFMKGGTISGCTSNTFGGGVYVPANATFNMSGGTISNCSGTNGGGVYVLANATFNMSGGTISNCVASGLGSGIYTAGKVNISGNAKINSNKPKDWNAITYSEGYPQVQKGGVYGGGIYAIGEEAVINMSGGEISDNWAPSGGGIMLWVGSKMTITGGEISRNYAIGTGGLGNGGAIYVQTATLNLNGGTLKDNTAIRYGGAVNLNQSATLKLEGACTITGNKACHGGGISQEAGECTLTLDNSGININANIAHGHQDSVDENDNHTLSKGKGNGGGLFIEKGTLTINAGTISNNIATGHGGGASLYVKRIHGGTTIASIKGATISGNKAEYGGGLDLYADHSIEEGKKNELLVNFESGTLSHNIATENGAGIYVSFNEENSTAKMNVGTTSTTPSIKNNKAEGNGGGLGMSNQGEIDVKNVSLSNNEALIGGGIWLGQGTFTIANGEIQTNAASADGGAIYVGSGTFTLNGNCEATGNTATNGNGGAIYLGGGTFTVNNNGKLILGSQSSSNTALNGNGGAIYCAAPFTANGEVSLLYNQAKEGGAIYVSNTMTLFKNTIIGNQATNGGAIYATGNVTMYGDSEMTNNTASADGGAIYVSGGNINAANNNIQVLASGNKSANGGVFFVNTGNVSLDKATMENNEASANGGAIALYNGTFSMSANSRINRNKATSFGGGLYAYNDATSSQATISCTGGTFTGNDAKAGGAVCAEGNIKLTLAANMEANKALIGGGIYMANGVEMIFGNGLIRANEASGETDQKTAIGKNHESVSGVGGGIFMADETTLTFDSQELGIYNNSATNAGADICANGNSTSITLLPIQGMNLKGFDVPGNDLYWVYDYFEDDTNAQMLVNTSLITRYEQLLLSPNIAMNDYIVQNNKTANVTIQNKYVCLDLGYDLVFVKFIVSGVERRDNVAVLMSYPRLKEGTDDTYEYIEYRKVLFNGSQNKIVGLPSGEWKFDTSKWDDIKYNEPTYTPSQTVTITREEKKDIEITLKKIQGEDIEKELSKTYEHYKINRMIP